MDVSLRGYTKRYHDNSNDDIDLSRHSERPCPGGPLGYRFSCLMPTLSELLYMNHDM
jgi:hypothetical protein